ncbi:heavy metal sensor histidine kinase [Janthinobacterium sp. PAMC25594]|uniref:heavy metal sensor histidine kinase n=1 Tax=Janthinobacterium sp. PAMC25594 TaxID=2861284 RepID=UPI001C62B8F7|nr:heavy metal sensor histidine kinase [Janthinobacterium sp. PAMC25594]QYG08898.1 heavy metal sensor histidine kinase [Janthinobacterium sp. PAMC25594]
MNKLDAWLLRRPACDPRRWSLMLRMTLFFALAIALILIAVSAMMYHELVHQLHEKQEIEIRDALRIEHEVLEKQARKSVPDLWQHEWGEQVEEGKRFSWRLWSGTGLMLAESSLMAAPPDGYATPNRRGKFSRRNVMADGQLRHLLLIAQRSDERDGAVWIMHGALDVSEDEQVVERYLYKLSSALAVAIVLSGLVGWLLARQGLAPVRAMSSAIGRVSAEKLHARIGSEVWPADLRALAVSFDGMLARLEASFEQLSRFSSDLAHEFRSPINNLVAAASVTLTRARNADEYQETLEVVIEEGSRLSRMVSSMLFLARADNAKQWVDPEPLSTAQEFDKLLDFFEAVAEDSGVSITATGDFPILADPLLLRRALSNLIANALRYTPRGGAIGLMARDCGDAITLSVADNGSGIAAQHLPFLFERFYRADAARSSGESTGLGLAIVRSIVELHGGGVAAHSVTGQGSCFTLSFPKLAPVQRIRPSEP